MPLSNFDGNIPLAFERYDDWPDNVSPARFYEVLTDRIIQEIRYPDGDLDQTNEANEEDEYHYSDEDDIDEEEKDLNGEIPPPKRLEKPTHTSLFMTGLQKNRIEQASQVYQQMKAIEESAPRVRNSFQNPAEPKEFSTPEKFKHRKDIRMEIVDRGGEKRATVTIFVKN